MTENNLKRLRAYQDKLYQLEKLPSNYPRPIMSKEDYERWHSKIKVEMPLKLNLLKLLIP